MSEQKVSEERARRKPGSSPPQLWSWVGPSLPMPQSNEQSGQPRPAGGQLPQTFCDTLKGFVTPSAPLHSPSPPPQINCSLHVLRSTPNPRQLSEVLKMRLATRGCPSRPGCRDPAPHSPILSWPSPSFRGELHFGLYPTAILQYFVLSKYFIKDHGRLRKGCAHPEVQIQVGALGPGFLQSRQLPPPRVRGARRAVEARCVHLWVCLGLCVILPASACFHLLGLCEYFSGFVAPVAMG